MLSTQKTVRIWLHISLAILGLLTSGVSLYLTHHYYQVMFPKNLTSGILCDISQFWNCDSAVFSRLGNVFNIPTALLGVIFGLILLFGAIVRKNRITETNYFLALINLLGCALLFSYSLIFLKGLCPGCTIYYFLSLITVLAFLCLAKIRPKPAISILLFYGAFAAATMLGAYAYNYERFKKQDEIYTQWIHELKKEKVFDDSALDGAMWLTRSTEKFSDAPLRITIFSDFQCPYCKILGNEIMKIARHYRGLINIRYMFSPLDSSCNKAVKTVKHPLACLAARLSYCSKENFPHVHDDIYAHQENLTREWLAKKAQDLNIVECYQSKESEEAVTAIVNQGSPFQIDGAPTMFVNGRKITGLVPTKALIVLLDAWLKDAHGAP